MLTGDISEVQRGAGTLSRLYSCTVEGEAQCQTFQLPVQCSSHCCIMGDNQPNATYISEVPTVDLGEGYLRAL